MLESKKALCQNVEALSRPRVDFWEAEPSPRHADDFGEQSDVLILFSRDCVGGVKEQLIRSEIRVVRDEGLLALAFSAHDKVAHEQAVLHDEVAVLNKAEPVMVVVVDDPDVDGYARSTILGVEPGQPQPLEGVSL